MTTSGDKEDMVMKKEKYERIELEVIEFITEDIILTSGDPDEYEAERTVIWKNHHTKTAPPTE